MRRPLQNTLIHLETKDKLQGLYLEYKRLNYTKEDNHRLDHLITIIGQLEYKLIIQLKTRQVYGKASILKRHKI